MFDSSWGPPGLTAQGLDIWQGNWARRGPAPPSMLLWARAGIYKLFQPRVISCLTSSLEYGQDMGFNLERSVPTLGC